MNRKILVSLVIAGVETLLATAYWHLLQDEYPLLIKQPLIMNYSFGVLEVIALYSLWQTPVWLWQILTRKGERSGDSGRR